MEIRCVYIKHYLKSCVWSFCCLKEKNINLHDRKIYKSLFIKHCLDESVVAYICKVISNNMHKFKYFSRLKYLFQFGLLYINCLHYAHKKFITVLRSQSGYSYIIIYIVMFKVNFCCYFCYFCVYCNIVLCFYYSFAFFTKGEP